MPKSSEELTRARRDEIVNACASLYESMSFKEITLKEIADALEVRFVELAWHSGGTDLPCMVASGMAEVMDGLFDDLDQRCRDRMAQLRLPDLETQLEHAAARKEMTHGL